MTNRRKLAMKAEEIKKLSQSAREWIESSDGQAALKKAIEDAQKTTSRLEKARQVDPEELHRHFTCKGRQCLSAVSIMTPQKIGNQILNQDNRATDQPIFIVEEKRRIWGMDSAYADEYRWVNQEDPEIIADKPMSIGLDIQEHDGEDTSPWERVYFLDHWEFITACFTEAGCKEFIDKDGHNHGELRIFAAGSFRNSEWRTVRDFLLRCI